MTKKLYLQSNQRKSLATFLILLTMWGVMTLLPMAFEDKTGRLLADFYDRTVYFERGKWFTEHTLPISEYPQIPTLLFGLNNIPFMLLSGKTQLIAYTMFFSLEMMLVLFLTHKTLLALLPASSKSYSFLVLLPATLYFTYNRFDILPAYLCLTAYLATTKRQWTITSILLAIATFTKWYPALLFPAFFVYASRLESRWQWKMIAGFSVTSIVILLLTYLWGGTQAILAPYEFHLARGMEYIALPVLVNELIRNLSGIDVNLSYLFFFCFFLQVVTLVSIFLVKIDSLETLVDYSIVAIGMFVLFSRIWSPQWFLWLFPFLVISIKGVRKVLLIVLYDLMSYLCFPILFDSYGASSNQLKIAGLLTFFILFAIIFDSFRNLRSDYIRARNT